LEPGKIYSVWQKGKQAGVVSVDEEETLGRSVIA
jgi:hypothetical protein